MLSYTEKNESLSVGTEREAPSLLSFDIKSLYFVYSFDVSDSLSLSVLISLSMLSMKEVEVS